MVAVEMEKRDGAAAMSPGEAAKGGARPVDRQGLLQHSREFLDFFWDIAKPQQETRLEATEKLLEYLRARPEVWRRGPGQGCEGLSKEGLGVGGTRSRT